MEDVTVPAEEFEYSVQGFEDTYEEDGNNEVTDYPISIIRKPPAEEEDEEACEGKPFEKFDLCRHGKETERSYQ